MSDFAMPARLFLPTTRGLLATVNLPAVPHQPLPPFDERQMLPRPFLAPGELEVPGSTTDLAVVVNPQGEVTVPDFYERALPDRLWGHWENICRLLDTAHPLGIKFPGFSSLVGWIDGEGEARDRGVNMAASMLIRARCSAPGSLVHGPILITGGMPRRPAALSLDQVTEILEDLLGIEIEGEDEDGSEIF